MEKENFTKQDIIDRIASLRTEKKISAYKLGVELGHSKTYMYRVETGEIQLTLDKFLEILEVLNVTTTEFFCPSIKKQEPLFDLIAQMPDDAKSALFAFINKLKY